MNKLVIILLLLICGTNGYINDSIVMASEKTKSVNSDKPKQDSQELMYQDMLMLFLLPHMDKKIDEIYANLLNYSPEIYPYFVEVKDVHRVNGFRKFHFLITLEVIPTVGPHIPVGKDILIFDISPVNPDNVKLLSWKHIKDPQKSDFPPNWQDVLRE
ncbi:MAG: DUF3888 domain-containing protein [Candidatus Pristimantibacillus sp.]